MVDQNSSERSPHTREHYGYSWDRAGDRAVVDLASGEVESYKFRAGTTLPESLASVGFNPLGLAVAGTFGYLTGVLGGLGWPGAIGAALTTVGVLGTVHWAQSKEN